MWIWIGSFQACVGPVVALTLQTFNDIMDRVWIHRALSEREKEGRYGYGEDTEDYCEIYVT